MAHSSPSIIYRNLDGIERRLDAMNFLFVLMAAEFLTLAFGSVLEFTSFRIGLSRNYPETAVVAINWIIPTVLLIILCSLYRSGARYALPGSIAFAFLFLYLMIMFISAWYVNTRLNLMYADVRQGLERMEFEKSISAWIGYAGFLCVLAYVLHQIIRAGRDSSSTTDGESSASFGAEARSFEGFVLRLFVIPAICRNLPYPRNWISMALFFVSTFTFCFFLTILWNSLFSYFPALGMSARFPLQCFDRGGNVSECWNRAFLTVLGNAATFLANIGLWLGIVGAVRFAARRFSRVSLERLISKDRRPPILFLRSFRDDQVKLKKPRRPVFRQMLSFGEPRPTLDHVLIEEGTPHGPVIAIGAPGGNPPFGAARKYVTDEEWRDTVANLCRASRAVVLTLDETEGVRWEVQHLIEQNYLQKTLFVLPPRLIDPRESGLAIGALFTEHKMNNWISRAFDQLGRDRRYCVGWFWEDESKVHVLTTNRNSYLAYTCAVLSFLNR